jgi:hypothetical protein
LAAPTNRQMAHRLLRYASRISHPDQNAWIHSGFAEFVEGSDDDDGTRHTVAAQRQSWIGCV